MTPKHVTGLVVLALLVLTIVFGDTIKDARKPYRDPRLPEDEDPADPDKWESISDKIKKIRTPLIILAILISMAGCSETKWVGGPCKQNQYMVGYNGIHK